MAMGGLEQNLPGELQPEKWELQCIGNAEAWFAIFDFMSLPLQYAST